MKPNIRHSLPLGGVDPLLAPAACIASLAPLNMEAIHAARAGAVNERRVMRAEDSWCASCAEKNIPELLETD
jgi:hypothetical protein